MIVLAFAVCSALAVDVLPLTEQFLPGRSYILMEKVNLAQITLLP